LIVRYNIPCEPKIFAESGLWFIWPKTENNGSRKNKGPRKTFSTSERTSMSYKHESYLHIFFFLEALINFMDPNPDPLHFQSGPEELTYLKFFQFLVIKTLDLDPDPH
jgi:hypothetical protein